MDPLVAGLQRSPTAEGQKVVEVLVEALKEVQASVFWLVQKCFNN
jgi:hypothetical protein